MAAPLTTTMNFPPAVRADLWADLLFRATPLLHYMKVFKKTPKKKNSGDQMIFRKVPPLATNTVPLVEGVNPTGKRLEKTDVTATIKEYGDWVPLTSHVQAVMDHPILMAANEVLAEQAAQSIDLLLADAAAAGTSVLYGGTAAVRTDLLGTSHIVSRTLLRKAIRTLEGNNARKFNKMISASEKVSTTPVWDSYWAITTEDVYYDLKEVQGFIPVAEYSQSTQAVPGEVGAFENIRFLVSTQAKKFLAGGGSASGTQATGGTADVHTILIFAKEAAACIPLNGESFENIVHMPGSAGAANPLNRYGTSGWVARQAQTILDDNYLIRLEVAVSS